MQAFGDRLAAAVRATKTPVLVGLDPRWESLPASITSNVASDDLEGRAAAYSAFCKGVIDAVAPLVPAVKPQAAFFEELGPAGMAALAEVIRYATDKKLLVILDGKRNDIGSTAEAYAAAYLGVQSPWGADALTVNPYLGDDSLEPFTRRAVERDAGIFVLVKTSNPGGGMFQDLSCDGRQLYARVAGQVESLAAATRGVSGYGIVGAVVGATYPEQLAEIRGLMPHAWLLIPGFGAQGGSAKDVAAGFDQRGLGAIINNSRGIIFAHKAAPYGERHGAAGWQAAVENATLDMIERLRSDTPAGRLVEAGD